MDTTLGKSTEIVQLFNNFSRIKGNDEQLINEISKYLKNNTRVRVRDEEILMWLLDNDKMNVFVKLISDHEIFGPSSIEMLSQNKQRSAKTSSKNTLGEDVPIHLDGKLLSKILEKVYTTPAMQPFFEKIREINALTMPLNKIKTTKVEGANIEKDNTDIKSELQRILGEIQYSIYAGDLSYIRHLMSFLPPSLRNTVLINRFIEAINEQQATQSLEDQRAFLYEETSYIIDGCTFHDHLYNHDPLSPEEADKYIIALMGFGIGVGYYLIKDSESFLEKFESALTKSHFKEVRDREGNTLLHKAAAEGQVEVVDRILRLHADKKIEIDLGEDKNIHGHNVEACVQLNLIEEVLKVQLLQMLAAAKAGQYQGIEVQHEGKITSVVQSFSR